MTTKKNTNNIKTECKGNENWPCNKKQDAVNNYYYDYHYTYEKQEKEPFFTLTERGRKAIDFIAIIAIAAISGWAIYATVDTHMTVKRIENTLDKKAASVHTATSSNKTK